MLAARLILMAFRMDQHEGVVQMYGLVSWFHYHRLTKTYRPRLALAQPQYFDTVRRGGAGIGEEKNNSFISV